MSFGVTLTKLITGAFTNRVRFKAYVVFLVAWQLLIYYPLVHMVWGGGALMQWGVKDFGGGIVVHAIAGMSALASVLYLGSRKVKDLPHSVPLIAIGMTILWFGWFGFTAGNAFAMDDDGLGHGRQTKTCRIPDRGIGGFLGITLLGIFSTLSVNDDGANGLLYGGIDFFKKEVAAVAFASLYAFLITILIFFIIDNTMSLRVSKDIEEQGLDKHLHGEKAYNK